MNETELRQQLAASYKELISRGLTHLSSGNISARCAGGMLISPSGASAETIKPETFAFVNLEGSWSAGERPSSEWQMHLEIYRAYPKAGAVVHTHSDSCVAIASHQRSLPGFMYEVGAFGGHDVPCVPYSTFGSKELADDAVAALTDRSACLLANHGMITRARNLRAAIDNADRLETLCRQYLLALQMGEPKQLSPQEWTAFFAQSRSLSYGA